MLRNFHDITNVLFINLDSRTDRRTHFELQFSEIGFHPQRFAAIQNARGAIGCTMSHIACMETAIQNNWDHVLVCEDDATIINPGQLVHQVNHFFQRFNDSWDVLLLAGNNYQPFRQESSEAVRVANCQTSTAYLARRPYFETLLANFKEGLSKLKAIDQYWKLLQRTDRWYLIVPISVIQRSDFSDISKRHVDYSDVMTQINKKRNRHVVRKLVVPVKSRLRNSIKNGIGGENVWFM
jgi:GR25 family glycosyltransferase involved in LPS biosynthesis